MTEGEIGPFIGKGWQFPPAFGKAGHTVRMVSGSAEVEQAIEILLKTAIGERLMHQEFGCSLQAYAFESFDATLLNEIKGNIQQAMINHERRINVLNVELGTDKATEGVLEIFIDYLIPETNSRYNQVFPFYLQEANNN
ncbi:MAG: GPW/gp25 family protein [Bacteroidota bacterium]